LRLRRSASGRSSRVVPGSSAITVKTLGIAGELNVPISCGGIVVKPGDAILRDESGILVLDPGEICGRCREGIGDAGTGEGDPGRLRAGKKLPSLTGSAELIRAAMQRERA